MPVKKSAFKRLRQSQKKALRNKATKDNIDYLLRQARKEIDAGSKDKANDWVFKAQKAIDKAMQHGTLKKNTGARKKSRLMKKYNSLNS
jgi:small subunit ribosomal protein S20